MKCDMCGSVMMIDKECSICGNSQSINNANNLEDQDEN